MSSEVMLTHKEEKARKKQLELGIRFTEATQTDDANAVRQIINEGFNANAEIGLWYVTKPLIHATRNDKVKTVCMLLANGAHPEAPIDVEKTALSEAKRLGNNLLYNILDSVSKADAFSHSNHTQDIDTFLAKLRSHHHAIYKIIKSRMEGWVGAYKSEGKEIFDMPQNIFALITKMDELLQVKDDKACDGDVAHLDGGDHGAWSGSKRFTTKPEVSIDYKTQMDELYKAFGDDAATIIEIS
jgi:hypothetical protein